jgi:Flavin containing amine oxidoreductase
MSLGLEILNYRGFAMRHNTGKPKVTIVGAGIAGLTAAFRLAQRGFEVTIFESDDLPGGNLGGNRGGTRDSSAIYDVYPHMFGEWYNNFWALMKDIGLTRETNFERLPACGFLRAGEFPNYGHLVDNGSAKTVIPNLFSGIIPVPDMFLACYAIIDLLTQDFSSHGIGSEQTLNGFLVTRPYATDRMAEYFNMLDKNIWSLDSYLTSAYAFQCFAKYQFREPSPQCWVLKGNSYKEIIEPLCRVLRERWGCTIMNNRRVDGVTVRQGRVTQISYREMPDSAGGKTTHNSQLQEVDNLILAVAPTSLAELVLTKASADQEGQAPANGTEGVSREALLRERIEAAPISRSLPQLAGTRRLESEPIRVLYAKFRRELPNIPRYYVALIQSKYSLTFVRSESLTEAPGTVLAIAVSDFASLPVDLDSTLVVDENHFPNANEETLREATFLILKEFRRYVPFRLGACWGDPDSDVDWGGTFLESNSDQRLFMNEVGSRVLCPDTHYPNEIGNLYFAGETCNNPIIIATVEAAVCSGLQAARALWQKHGAAAERGDRIDIIVPRAYPLSLLLAWKFALAPYAALAKCWAIAEDYSRVSSANRPSEARPMAARAASLFAEGVASASTAYIDWWKMVGSAVGRMVR